MNQFPPDEIEKRVAAIRFAAGEVAKLAANLVGNMKSDGTRDARLYEQGIGCEKAAMMLREVANLIERTTIYR